MEARVGRREEGGLSWRLALFLMRELAFEASGIVLAVQSG